MSDAERGPGMRVRAAVAGQASLAVIIPTLNRPQDLEAAVRTLLAQTVLPAELFIIDQSKSDEAERRVCALFAERKEAQIKLCYTRDSRISGAAEARNVAIERNSSEIILFLDDDVELEPDFIERLLEGYQSDAGVAGISGIITNYTAGSFAHRVWHSLFLRGPFHDDRQEHYIRAEELRGAGRIPVSRFTGALMSFRAACVGDLRFDRNLRGACEGEDVDFCLHLPQGSRLEIDPRARLVHKVSTMARKDEHWIASVVRGNTYLYYRNWRHGLRNRMAFAWLMTGYALLAITASAKRSSLGPWRAFTGAAGDGKRLGSLGGC